MEMESEESQHGTVRVTARDGRSIPLEPTHRYFVLRGEREILRLLPSEFEASELLVGIGRVSR